MNKEKTAETNIITVLIAEDHTVVREGLAALIGLEPNIEVVAQVSNGRQAVKFFDELRPQVTLVDLNMPVMDGAATIAQIRLLEPAAKVIVLTRRSAATKTFTALCKPERADTCSKT